MKWQIDDALTSTGRGHGGRGAASVVPAGNGLSAGLRFRANDAKIHDPLPALVADLKRRLAEDAPRDPRAEGITRRLAELQQQQAAARAKLAALAGERDALDLLADADLGGQLIRIEAAEQHIAKVLEATNKALAEVQREQQRQQQQQAAALRQRVDAAVEVMRTEALQQRQGILAEIVREVSDLLDRLATAEARVGLLVYDHAKVKDTVLLSTATAEAA